MYVVEGVKLYVETNLKFHLYVKICMIFEVNLYAVCCICIKFVCCMLCCLGEFLLLLVYYVFLSLILVKPELYLNPTNL